MHTLKLKVSDKTYEKLMWFLGKFSKDEIEITIEDSKFASDKKYLEKELNDILSGEASFIGVDEAEQQLEKSIRQHEDTV